MAAMSLSLPHRPEAYKDYTRRANGRTKLPRDALKMPAPTPWQSRTCANPDNDHGHDDEGKSLTQYDMPLPRRSGLRLKAANCAPPRQLSLL